MDKAALDALVERVNALEVKTRRWKQAFLATAIGTIVLTIGGADLANLPDVVEAKKAFILRDKDGEIRTALYLAANGDPVLDFYGKNEKVPRLVITTNSSGGPSGFFLVDRDGKNRLHLGDYLNRKDKNTVGLIFASPDGCKLQMSLTDKELPNLYFYDKKSSRLGMVVDQAGEAGLEVIDQSGIQRVWLGVTKKGTPILDINKEKK